MTIVFDIDDTLSETDGYSKEYIAKFFLEHNLPYKQVTDIARFAERYFDWDKDTALNWYKQYGDEMMLNFPPKPNAVAVINSLFEAGHKIILATARATDWHVDPEGITTKWLEINKIKYHKLYVGRIDKEQICLTEQADIFVDDDIKLCAKVQEHCKNTLPLLISTKYNLTLETPENIKRIYNLKEILNYININTKIN